MSRIDTLHESERKGDVYKCICMHVNILYTHTCMYMLSFHKVNEYINILGGHYLPKDNIRNQDSRIASDMQLAAASHSPWYG